MTKKVIARPNTFADYDAEEEEGRPTGRRHLPMAEANQVRDTGILSFAAAQDWPHGPIENMMILSLCPTCVQSHYMQHCTHRPFPRR